MAKTQQDETDILTGVIIPFVAATLVVGTRLWSRRLIHSLGRDDLLIFISWFFTLAIVMITTVQTRYGLGSHYDPPHKQNRPMAIAVSFATIACYQVCLVTTKLSILFFYRRILKLPIQQTVLIAVIAFVSVYGTVLFILTFFLCNPLYGGYELNVKVGICLDYYPVMTVSASLHTAVDVFLIAMVLPHVISMKQLPGLQKAALGFILTMGFFVACASLTRISVAWQFLNPKYSTWSSFSFTVWTTLECSLGLFCASAPMLKPAVRRCMGWSLRREGNSPRGNVEEAGEAGGEHTVIREQKQPQQQRRRRRGLYSFTSLFTRTANEEATVGNSSMDTSGTRPSQQKHGAD